MKIAIAQLNPKIGDLEYNARQIQEMAQLAVSKGAKLLLTPELSLCGYPPRDLLLNPNFITRSYHTLKQLCRTLPPSLAVMVGMPQINDHGTIEGEKPLFNSMALIEGMEVKQIFQKRLLPTYDVFDEDRYFASGKESDYFTLENVKIGVSICEDLWNQEEFWGKRQYEVNPIADLARLGVDLIVNLSASPYTVRKQEIREAMLSHSINIHRIPTIYVNQIGGNDDLIFDGYSVALNRQGEVICRLPGFTSSLEILDYSTGERDLLPSAIHPLCDSEDQEIYGALVLGLRDYARKCGFNKIVLGLSGGIDSALVATIAVSALGKNNVLGVLMPSPYSSQHSVGDALQLGQNLDIECRTLPIESLMSGYDRLLDPLFADTDFGVAEENIQSRIRGTILMAIANKFGYLLVSTGNKSEMAVGYCTLYGDMNGGLGVIADVPKMRVYSLCRWLNRETEIIPRNIIDKPPSAELKPGQLDQDSLPPYEILDDILHRVLYRHRSPQELIGEGFKPETVEQIFRLLKNAEFKRKQAPPGLKITDRAFGTGWRMPIASSW
ncbi:MAG: Glutamine-dependent NAD(+) synthetase [Chroococcopsis gigantea SAG 12.99]|jgi:NAD+ synthase (glutamine-hydrolysing)|nr:NAD+ synthase [Chlorogloea purpurea SAG 13.99]MDV3000582.1 Glutamine-dependent NAD(+) synthetase [Chroococcopsis gigantea SAG 12.99]